jgi:hypothetical protein
MLSNYVLKSHVCLGQKQITTPDRFNPSKSMRRTRCFSKGFGNVTQLHRSVFRVSGITALILRVKWVAWSEIQQMYGVEW